MTCLRHAANMTYERLSAEERLTPRVESVFQHAIRQHMEQMMVLREKHPHALVECIGSEHSTALSTQGRIRLQMQLPELVDSVGFGLRQQKWSLVHGLQHSRIRRNASRNLLVQKNGAIGIGHIGRHICQPVRQCLAGGSFGIQGRALALVLAIETRASKARVRYLLWLQCIPSGKLHIRSSQGSCQGLLVLALNRSPEATFAAIYKRRSCMLIVS